MKMKFDKGTIDLKEVVVGKEYELVITKKVEGGKIEGEKLKIHIPRILITEINNEEGYLCCNRINN